MNSNSCSLMGVLIIGSMIFSNSLFGQSDIVNSETTIENDANFLFRQLQLGEENINSISSSNVYIRQVGQSNKVFTYAQTSKGSISVLQEGNNNKAGLFLKAETIEYNLTQSGNDNKYLHFNKSNPDLIKVNAVQQGNDTDIIIHGKNSISEKMKINMIGNDRALIIRNFN